MMRRDSNHSGSGEPPALAIWMLEHLLEPATRDALLGDLLEQHEGRLASRGRGAARRRFWWETLVAIRHFGALPWPQRRHHRDSFMSSFAADVRYGARVLRRAPAFALLCTVTLALAIGPTTAIFSVVDPLLIEPLPYPHPDRLAFIWERGAEGGRTTIGFATVQDLRGLATTLQSVAATGWWETTLSDPAEPEHLSGALVSSNYFGTLGVHPALGRDFALAEDRPGSNSVVILTHALWVRRFAGDAGIIGKKILLDGTAKTVVGVLPAGYDDVVHPDAQIFRPLGYSTELPWACRSCRHLTAIARLREGVPRQRALAELDQISAQLARAYPKEYPAAGMFLVPMQRQITQEVRPALLAIAGAVALVLLIALANVVNLQLARAVRREDEFAVRVALGAGSARLVQQLVAEGLVIATAGGVLGVTLGAALLPLLVTRLPRALPRVDAIHFEFRAVVLVVLLVALVAIVLGLAPARGTRRMGAFAGTLRGATKVSAGAHHRLRAALVVSEVALALLLFAGAALLASSLTRLLAVDPGFDPSNLVTMRVEAAGPSYRTNEAVLAHRRRVLAAAREIPGVIDASTTTTIPLAGSLDMYGITTQDHPLANPELAPTATGYRVVGPLLRTMRIRLLAGREFTDAEERDTASAVAIVSQSLARTLWPGQPALGRRIHVPNATARWSTVIGVVADVRHRGLDETDARAVYVPESGWIFALNDVMLVARVRGDAAASMRAIRAGVAAVDPSQPVTDVRTMENVVASSTAQRQLAMLLFGAFALLALLLAAAGIYGVLAGSVAERTREIGLRSALGASASDLVMLVLARGLGLATVGVAFGLLGAVATTRYLRSLLYGVGPTDPWILAGAAVVLFGIAVGACLGPARRAVRVDPMVALRG